jgi:glycosyltransferase involved in cell wall biosynthesis
LKKLIIQIPCFNEEGTLALALAELPRAVPGFDVVEWLVIDDGSTDGTVALARACGVDHVVSLPRNQGLARAFTAGLAAAVERGADVIVNTDADNQYDAADIPALVGPILEGRAEIVVGARPIGAMEQYSWVKRMLHRAGTWVVRRASRTDIPDAPSGFRALSRHAAMRINVFSDYTYTLETVIQAGQKAMAITSVPVRTNPDLRPSRLVRSIGGYVRRSMLTIVRIFMTYRPLTFFGLPGAASFGLGFVLGLRYLWFVVQGSGKGHVQSVILAALLLGLGLFLIVVGLLADLISVNRKLLEKVDYRVQRLEEAVSRARAAAGSGAPR